MNKLVCALAIATLLAGCGNADREKAAQLQAEVSSLKSELSKVQEEAKGLRKDLDEERHGPMRLLARGQGELESGDRKSAKRTFAELASRFPETDQAKTAKRLIGDIDAQNAAAEKAKAAEAAREAEEKRQAMAKLDSSLKKTTDEFNGITWYKHKGEPTRGKFISLYFGTKNGSAAIFPLRLKLHYQAEDWLFIDKVTIKADEKAYDLGKIEFQRDNGGGTIWEWSDTAVTDIPMIRKIVESKRAVIRYEGSQYRNDFVIPDAQKRIMKDMLLASQRHGGKP